MATTRKKKVVLISVAAAVLLLATLFTVWWRVPFLSHRADKGTEAVTATALPPLPDSVVYTRYFTHRLKEDDAQKLIGAYSALFAEWKYSNTCKCTPSSYEMLKEIRKYGALEFRYSTAQIGASLPINSHPEFDTVFVLLRNGDPELLFAKDGKFIHAFYFVGGFSDEALANYRATLKEVFSSYHFYTQQWLHE